MFQYYRYIKQSKEIANQDMTIETLIIDENYYITNFDLILISDFYKIPLTMIALTSHKGPLFYPFAVLALY